MCIDDVMVYFCIIMSCHYSGQYVMFILSDFSSSLGQQSDQIMAAQLKSDARFISVIYHKNVLK